MRTLDSGCKTYLRQASHTASQPTRITITSSSLSAPAHYANLRPLMAALACTPPSNSRSRIYSDRKKDLNFKRIVPHFWQRNPLTEQASLDSASSSIDHRAWSIVLRQKLFCSASAIPVGIAWWTHM